MNEPSRSISPELTKKIVNYSPTRQTLAELRGIPIVLLSAISGTGKNSIIDKLLETYPDRYKFLLSHTTRKPRVNNGVMEQEGVNYHFIDFKEAERLLDDKRYVEVNWYAGNMYGTTVDAILAAYNEGKIPINEIEVQGADDFAERVPSAQTIFVLPPSYEEWQKRLRSRYGDWGRAYTEDLLKRMQTAKLELENALQSKHFSFVVNDQLDQAVRKVDHLARFGQLDEDQTHAREIVGLLYQATLDHLAKR